MGGDNQELLSKYGDDAVVKSLVEAQGSHPDNICAQTFDLKYLDEIVNREGESGGDAGKKRFLQCLRSGAENKDSGMGCYANQPNDYDDFIGFFGDAIAKYHKVDKGTKHVNDWDLSAEDVKGKLPEGGKLDLSAIDKSLEETSMRVRVGRNLKQFPLPGSMTAEDRVAMEKKLAEGPFKKLQEDPEIGGQYYSLTPDTPYSIDDAKYKELVDAHIMFKDMSADPYLNSAGISSGWPLGRGCFVSEDKGFIIWVGEEDHLRIMCMKKGKFLNDVFDRLKKCLDIVESLDGLDFAKSDQFGYVTSCPTNLGTGMRASVHIKVPNLTSDGTDKKAKEICKPLGLSVRGVGGEHTPIGADGTIDLSPSARFAIKESHIICALYEGIKKCFAAEQAAAK